MERDGEREQTERKLLTQINRKTKIQVPNCQSSGPVEPIERPSDSKEDCWTDRQRHRTARSCCRL